MSWVFCVAAGEAALTPNGNSRRWEFSEKERERVLSVAPFLAQPRLVREVHYAPGASNRLTARTLATEIGGPLLRPQRNEQLAYGLRGGRVERIADWMLQMNSSQLGGVVAVMSSDILKDVLPMLPGNSQWDPEWTAPFEPGVVNVVHADGSRNFGVGFWPSLPNPTGDIYT